MIYAFVLDMQSQTYACVSCHSSQQFYIIWIVCCHLFDGIMYVYQTTANPDQIRGHLGKELSDKGHQKQIGSFALWDIWFDRRFWCRVCHCPFVSCLPKCIQNRDTWFYSIIMFQHIFDLELRIGYHYHLTLYTFRNMNFNSSCALLGNIHFFICYDNNLLLWEDTLGTSFSIWFNVNFRFSTFGMSFSFFPCWELILASNTTEGIVRKFHNIRRSQVSQS